MKEKNKKKQIAKISIFITSIFVILLSITYAFMTETLTGTKKVTITAGTLSLVLDEKNEITISDGLPMYDQVGMIQEEVFTFDLINETSNPTAYTLKLQKVSTSNELQLSDVKYYLTKDGVGQPALLSSLAADGTVDSGTIAGNDTIEYTLRLWIRDGVTDITTIQGKSLSYKISLEVKQIIEEIVLAPGLYDENDNLIVSWEESGINVERNYSGNDGNTDYYKTNENSGYYVTQITYPDTRKVVIPDSVKTIGSSAFQDCTGLTSVTIGNGVTEILVQAFRNCTGLTEVVIPDSVTSIGDYAFTGCTDLASIVIGDGVTSIGPGAFQDCTGLTSIVIPDSVTIICGGAFRNCTGLTSVTIGNGVTEILYQAFQNCKGLTSIVIPESVTSIGQEVFTGCNLTSVEFKDTETWYVGYNKGSTKTALDSSSLANQETAAIWLIVTHDDKYWTKQ